MKKIIFIFLIVFGLSVCNVTQASAGCNIVWTGYYSDSSDSYPVSGSTPTNETSRTLQAAQELFDLINIYYQDNCVCGISTPSFINNCYEYSGYSPMYCSSGESVCTSGTWSIGCYTRELICRIDPTVCFSSSGTWDVICNSTTTTTSIIPTTTSSVTTSIPPTIVELSTFTAIPKAGIVTIQWSTETEIDNAGFNIYRSKSENGEYIQINDSLIPTKGSPTQGASYEFVDKDVKNRQPYYYKLEDIDLNGNSTMHGPESATPRLIYGIGK